jgi:hypothetical protein
MKMDVQLNQITQKELVDISLIESYLKILKSTL